MAHKKTNSKGKARRNVSRKIPNGTTFQTRDEYFLGQKRYRKPNYEKKGMYRKVVVVDSNKMDELAVIKLGTSSGTLLPDYGKGVSRYKPIVQTLDHNGNSIKEGTLFVRNGHSQDMTLHDVNKIKKDMFGREHKSMNRKRLRKLKGRK